MKFALSAFSVVAWKNPDTLIVLFSFFNVIINIHEDACFVTIFSK